MKKFLFILLSMKALAFAQETYDSECRVQAKEAAINTYQSCVKEARTQKIDEIRKEYQEKLTELKSYYDGELKKLSSTKASNDNLTEENSATSAQPTIQLKKKTKKTKKQGNAQAITQLPTKKSTTTTLPVQNVAPVEVDNKEISTSSTTSDEKTFETEL